MTGAGWMIPGRFITAEEFERLQLKAHNCFCRACGVLHDTAIPMEHVDIVDLEINEQASPGADQGRFSAHLYLCPVCGHRALSEQHRSNGEASQLQRHHGGFDDIPLPTTTPRLPMEDEPRLAQTAADNYTKYESHEEREPEHWLESES